jgi:hypothetical protein
MKAMATFRVTWQYKSGSGSNWNEVFYLDASTPAIAATVFPALLSFRLLMLHPQNTLLGIRSAQVGVARKTAFSPMNLPGTATLSVLGEVGPDVAGTAMVLGLGGVNGGSRKLWLRGVPDGFTILDPNNSNAFLLASVKALIVGYIRNLALNGYGLLQVMPPAPGALTNLPIISVDGSAKNGTSVVTTMGVPVYPPGSRVIIGGCSPKNTPALNGRFSLIGGITGSTFVIPYQTPQGIIVTENLGHVRQETFAAVNVVSPTASNFLYFGTRKTKNAFSRSRGARRAVRIRQSL